VIIEIEVGSDAYTKLDRIIDRLSEVYASIPRDAHQAVLETANKAAQEAGAKVLTEPAFGPDHTGLREKVKEGVGVKETRDGARVTTSMPKSDEAVIPRGLDGFGGWRHPLFGDKSRWFRQEGGFSWFMDTMSSQHDGLERKLAAILDEAAKRVAA
jgi:hypothetical protein